MQKAMKKTLSIMLAAMMMLSFLSIAALADGEPVVTGGDTITDDGVYQIAADATGTITVGSDVTDVTLIGNGAVWDPSTFVMTSAPNNNLKINCTAAPGLTLTLQDVYFSDTNGAACMIDFSGTENTLNFEGVNVIDYITGGGGQYSAIHVSSDTDLTIGGAGTLYLYKDTGGAGFGGNQYQMNGELTFGSEYTPGPVIFIKGTRQGALIGAGANASSTSESPGAVSFLSGEYNLVAVARGAAIGGSAGSGGGSTGTSVTFGKDASVNINVDYSGSAVGGGGYDGGNDSSGGSVYFNGGSLRVNVDKNAAGNAGWGMLSEGINDRAITAEKLNSANESVYKAIFDTTLLDTSASSFNVFLDGAAESNRFFSGGLHGYFYLNEGIDRDLTLVTTPASTPQNWLPNDDTCLYFYLTGEDHTLYVNGEEFSVTYNAAIVDTDAVFTTGPFTIEKAGAGGQTGDPDSPVWDGTLDFRWYDENDVKTEYHITTPAQWAALAWICSEESAFQKNLTGLKNDFTAYTNGNIIDIYGDIPTYQQVFEGVQFYLDNDIDMGGVYNSGTKTWSGPNYYPVGSQALNDLGVNSSSTDYCFYGLFYGSFDGQNHVVKNIYCDRGSGQNWQSVGLFGRIGSADGVSPQPACNIVIENVAVTGYIKSGRSVGGIVGKTLHVATGYSVTVRNCLNFVEITSSDAKGTAGVVGAGWNTPIFIDNCANFAKVTANYQNGGGISGSFEGASSNCYNVGDISGSAPNHGQSFGTNNGGANVYNFYWLTGTSNTAGNNAAIYNPSSATTTYEITDNYNGSGLTAIQYMKSEAFLDGLNLNGENWAFAQDTDPIYILMDSMGLAGYPVPAGFATPAETPVGPELPFPSEAPPAGTSKWDGSTIDVSWYDPDGTILTIYTAEQLAGFAAIVNNKQPTSVAGALAPGTGIDPTIPADDFLGKTVILAADIDLGGVEEVRGGLIGADEYVRPVWSGNTWTPIGSNTESSDSSDGLKGRPFKGTFDGGFHKIYNMYSPGNFGGTFDNALDNTRGLFGHLGQAGTVKNVIVRSGYLRGARFTAGIVGRNWGKVENYANYATIETDGQRSGGGIVGANYNNGNTAHILNCYNAGLIMTGDGAVGGGIASDSERPITNTYNIGRGYLKGAATSDGNLLSSSMWGIRGPRNSAAVTNSWSLIGDGMPTAVAANTTGVTNSGLKTAMEMKDADFAALLNDGGYAFAVDTAGVNGGFPVLNPIKLTGSIALDGTYEVGQTLTVVLDDLAATVAGVTPADFSFQWMREKSPVVPIAGATGSSYTLTADDEGAIINVIVVAKNASGSMASTNTEIVSAGAGITGDYYVSLATAAVDIDPGENFTVLIYGYSEDNVPIRGFSIDVLFDSANLTYVSTDFKLGTGAAKLSPYANNKVVMSAAIPLADSPSGSSGALLAEITFKVKEDAPGDSADVSIDDANLAVGDPPDYIEADKDDAEVSVDINNYTITFVPSTAVTDVTGVTGNKINKDENVTFKVIGYGESYTVTVKYTVAGGSPVTMTASGGIYTIPSSAITGNVTVTIEAVLKGDISFILNSVYNGAPTGYKVMLLENAILPAGMVFRYDGAKNLFYSSAYDAYVCIVPDDETAAGAREKLDIVSGTLISIIYDGDVNEDTFTDILDAIIVLDLYLNDYSYPITDLMRFMADVTGDKTVDIEDVLWILNKSLDR